MCEVDWKREEGGEPKLDDIVSCCVLCVCARVCVCCACVRSARVHAVVPCACCCETAWVSRETVCVVWPRPALHRHGCAGTDVEEQGNCGQRRAVRGWSIVCISARPRLVRCVTVSVS